MTLRGPPRRALRASTDLVVQHEQRDERVDRQRLWEGRDDDHVDLDLAGGLGLPRDPLHRALPDEAEADAGADRRDADAERESECESRLEIHGVPPYGISVRVLPPRA